MNLLGIAAQYPTVHLLTVEIVTCEEFLESEEKQSYEESILKEASNTSGLAIEHLHKKLFSLVNAGTKNN